MAHPQRQVRTVPITKIHEWLVWLGERPQNTERRRLRNRLSDFCRRSSASGSTLVAGETPDATAAADAKNGSGVDFTEGEIAFTPRPGFGTKSIDRLITRVVAVTGIPE